MKMSFVILISIVFLNVDSFTQISPFGLHGIKVRDLKIYGDTLYAAAGDSGVYRRNLNDPGWVNIGLKNKLIACIYPHAVDSKGFYLTVGAWVCCSLMDSTLIYSLSSSGWAPDDGGIGYSPANEGIVTINGFTYPENNRIMLAGGSCYDGWVFRRSNLLWENTTIYDNSMGGGVVKFSPNGDAWIGSGSGCATLWKSTDRGYTWEWMVPDDPALCHISGPHDIAFSLNNPDIFYIAGTGILKTTDRGVNWQDIKEGSSDLAIDPFNGDHVFAGSDNYGWLYETTDGGLNWDTIPKPEGADYITDLEINLTDSLELYIVTDSTGVYRLTQPSLACGRLINVNKGWNMLSVPNRVHNFSKNILLPSSISSTFTYKGSYTIEDTLQNGKGYWSKFNLSDVIKFIGEKITSDSINVNAGWNMIGSVSYPVGVSSIGSDPPDMIVNDFYTYKDNQYVVSDTIQPGIAYWVKTNKAGKLILDTTSSIMTSQLIKIVSDGELPPPPPGDHQIKLKEIPNKFALVQNYPNPFNPTTTFKYELPAESRVKLSIFNVLGQIVEIIVDEIESAGYRSIEWNARGVASGVYFYRLEASPLSDPSKSFVQVKKLLLVK